MSAKLKLNCRNCGRFFYRYKIRIRAGFCTRRCGSKYQSKMGKIRIKCAICNKQLIKSKSRVKRNNRTYCSKKCCGRGMSKYRSGKNSPAWQGGKTAEGHRIKHSLPYYNWRARVFKRDDYTCQICGERGGKLDADHIKPFSLFPKLRLSLGNGRTLCVLCHRQTETYGEGSIKTMKEMMEGKWPIKLDYLK